MIGLSPRDFWSLGLREWQAIVDALPMRYGQAAAWEARDARQAFSRFRAQVEGED